MRVVRRAKKKDENDLFLNGREDVLIVDRSSDVAGDVLKREKQKEEKEISPRSFEGSCQVKMGAYGNETLLEPFLLRREPVGGEGEDDGR